MVKHRTFFVIVAIITASAMSGSVSDSRAQNACAVLDKARPALFITYEKRLGSDVWLRLHNNSTCAIIVETSDDAPRRAGEGKPIAVHYLVHEVRKPARPAYGWGDSVGQAALEGNDALVFIVPLTHLKKDFGVAVPFVYAWETDHVGAGFVGGLQHVVYYLSGDLPPGIVRHR